LGAPLAPFREALPLLNWKPAVGVAQRVQRRSVACTDQALTRWIGTAYLRKRDPHLTPPVRKPVRLSKAQLEEPKLKEQIPKAVKEKVGPAVKYAFAKISRARIEASWLSWLCRGAVYFLFARSQLKITKF